MDATDVDSPLLRMIDFLNSGDVDSAMKLIAPDFEGEEVPHGGIIRGRDGVRAEAEGWAGLDGGQRISNVIVSGDRIVLEGVIGGTHSGQVTIGGEAFPPTGRHVEIRFCTIGTIRDGMVAREVHYYDMAALRAQLSAR
ncbi:ester cyclase [Sphingomonas flavalba]|uniref:ester cyclase n=1 Tax=Sphingomonas flavalba TaxID=2559804 RepID=UPI0039DF93CC